MANVEVVLGDALTIYLPAFDVLVSNPPYAITEALIHRLERLKFRAASLVLPSTLVKTLMANRDEPGYTKLSLEARLFYEVEVVSEVKSEAYHPEPKTATSIIVLRPKVELEAFRGCDEGGAPPGRQEDGERSEGGDDNRIVDGLPVDEEGG